jgi:hypothetical protein
MSFDLCLIDLISFNDLERNLVRCQTSFHIYLMGISFISIVTMALVTFLRSWALDVSSLAFKFYITIVLFSLETLVHMDFGTHFFQQQLKINWDFSPRWSMGVFLPLNILSANKLNSFKVQFHQHTFFNIFLVEHLMSIELTSFHG